MTSPPASSVELGAPEIPGGREAPIPPQNSAAAVLVALGLFCLVGVAFALWLRGIPAGRPDPRLWYNVFFVLFARHEPLGLALVALFSVATAVVIFRRTEAPIAGSLIGRLTANRFALAAIVFAVFVVAAAGTHLVSHDYGITADENMSDFQAKIFLRGRVLAEVPARWWPAERVVQPTYVDYFSAQHLWKSTYFPAYAVIRAVFQSAGLQSLLNPLCAALSVLAVYGTARNIWPARKENALVAALLLASSAQFLLMATTAYAMPAHLALNTIWLWLYSRPDRRRFYLAPLVGVIAIGLHQPIVHALFATPFLLRLPFQKRWRATVVYAVIYLAGCVGWSLWRQHYTLPPVPGGTPLQILKIWNPRMLIVQPMNLLLIIGWSALCTPLFALFGFRRFFAIPAILQDAALSSLLTFAFYYLFYLDQAHGWGYRYFHGALGCFVLIAVVGWNELSTRLGARRAEHFFVCGVVLSLLVQLPLRCLQVESFVRPFARTAAAFRAMNTDVVAFDPRDAWYSADLIRNDPFLDNHPIIVTLSRVTPDLVPLLQNAGTVTFIDRDFLTRMGMHTERREDYEHDPFFLGRGK